MKKLIISFVFLFSFLLISCNQKIKTQTSEKTENFDWLLGQWQRSNEEEGKETFENWEKADDLHYLGHGFTLQKEDTLKQERIQLVKQNGKWDLIVKVPDEAESITFKMAHFNEDSFTCENDSLDFPKLIKYWKDNDKLRAVVSNSDMEIPFEFEPIK